MPYILYSIISTNLSNCGPEFWLRNIFRIAPSIMRTCPMKHFSCPMKLLTKDKVPPQGLKWLIHLTNWVIIHCYHFHWFYFVASQVSYLFVRNSICRETIINIFFDFFLRSFESTSRSFVSYSFFMFAFVFCELYNV